jgi:hypothetical protein
VRLLNRIRLAVGLPFKPEDYGDGLTLLDPGPRTRAEREAWELEKQANIERAWAEWDTRPGTCLKCDLPIRLHPRERLLSCNPAYCDVARSADSGAGWNP